MKFRIDGVCEDGSGAEQPQELMTLSRDELAMETLELTLADSKQLLHALQSHVVDQQVKKHLEQHRTRPQCGCHFTGNGQGKNRQINTLFGLMSVSNPRWLRCDCDPDSGITFRPMASCLPDRSSPELQYLETKWASLIPYTKALDLLKEVLPVGGPAPQQLAPFARCTVAQLLQ
jgi:hypothetical protein